jgi:hypothetical protein
MYDLFWQYGLFQYMSTPQHSLSYREKKKDNMVLSTDLQKAFERNSDSFMTEPLSNPGTEGA